MSVRSWRHKLVGTDFSRLQTSAQPTHRTAHAQRCTYILHRTTSEMGTNLDSCWRRGTGTVTATTVTAHAFSQQIGRIKGSSFSFRFAVHCLPVRASDVWTHRRRSDTTGLSVAL